MQKRLIFPLVLFLFFSGLAQEQNGSVRSLVHSNRALLFEFNGLNLHSFQGGIGCKRWISSSLALLPVLKMAYSDEQNMNRSFYSNDKNVYRTSHLFGFDLSLAKYFGTKEKIAPFVLGGIGIAHNKMRYETEPESGSNTAHEIKFWDTNAWVGLGLEWIVNPRFSLAAQYALRMFYSSGESVDQYDQNKNTRDLSRFGFKLQALSITLSVYL